MFGHALDLSDPNAVPSALANGVKPVLSASSVLSMLSALKSAFETEHWQWPEANGQESLLRRLRMAIRKLAPDGAATDPLEVGHFAPHLVLPVLPAQHSDLAIRDRALFMVRAVSLLRPSEPLEILRSSVRVVDNGVGRRVVAFAVNRTKSSSAKGRVFDSNSVEFLSRSALVPNLPDGLVAADVCPALLLLALAERVELRAKSCDFDVPDRLFFCSDQRSGRFDLRRPLSAARASSVVARLLREAGAGDKARAHDLRAMSAQQLRLMGVEAGDIEMRGGWSSALASQVRINHYTSNRLVQDNFADMLFDERQRRERRQRARLQGGIHFLDGCDHRLAAVRAGGEDDNDFDGKSDDDDEGRLASKQQRQPRVALQRVLRSDSRRASAAAAEAAAVAGGRSARDVRARLGVSDSSSALVETMDAALAAASSDNEHGSAIAAINSEIRRDVESDELTTKSEIQALWQEAVREFGTVTTAQSDEDEE